MGASSQIEKGAMKGERGIRRGASNCQVIFSVWEDRFWQRQERTLWMCNTSTMSNVYMDFLKCLTTSGDPNENWWRPHVGSWPTGWEPLLLSEHTVQMKGKPACLLYCNCVETSCSRCAGWHMLHPSKMFSWIIIIDLLRIKSLIK